MRGQLHKALGFIDIPQLLGLIGNRGWRPSGIRQPNSVQALFGGPLKIAGNRTSLLAGSQFEEISQFRMEPQGRTLGASQSALARSAAPGSSSSAWRHAVSFCKGTG